VLHNCYIANYHEFARQPWETAIPNNQERICCTMGRQGVKPFPWDALEAKSLHGLNTQLA